MIEILDRYSKAVLYSCATATELVQAVAEAHKVGANLRGANLWGANLRGAKQRLIQIQGSRDQIVAIDDDVRIGCHRKTLAEWLGCYEELGAADRYSPAEIGEYGEHLRHIERVLAMPRDVAAGGA